MNSWGSSWGNSGYFKIGYGECYIETWENSTVSVDQSCLAKLVPNLINSLSTAFGYWWVNGEYAYALGNASTTSSLTVPSGTSFQVNPAVTLTFGSGANLSVNGTLSAVGTSSDRIAFTSSSGSWGGIVVNSGGNANIKYCDISNAGSGLCSGVYMNYGMATLYRAS